MMGINTVKIYAESPGDPSVGIPPEFAEIEMSMDAEDTDERERVRHFLKEAFINVFDNVDVWVRFEDEMDTPMPSERQMMKDQLVDTSDLELVSLMNVTLMSQVTLSSQQDKEHWRNLASCSLEILNERGVTPQKGKDNLYTL